MQLVDTVEVGAGGVASIDFNGIPQTGLDLVINGLFRSEVAAANEPLNMRFNADTGNNYDRQYVAGQGGSSGIDGVAAQSSMNIGEATGASVASRNARVSIIIPAYSSLVVFKGFTAHSGYSLGANAADQGVRECAGTWRNTDAITRVTIFCATADIAEGSFASLYTLSAG